MKIRANVYWKDTGKEVIAFRRWIIYLNYDKITGSLTDGRPVELIKGRWYLK
jgi:hypothetical protein